ncbi:MAG: recombinase family protein [Oscillospiraceae bacterium]|nr:recombinase family protein [Oscillospiraceae bacterium]
MVQVAIYVRLSSEDRDKRFKTDESDSIQNQKMMLKAYCKERNWDIYDIYCDEDYSGADSSRPDFRRMLEDCENKRVNIVLCKSQSRFSRDMEIIEKYLHNKFIEWGIRFISVVDHADTDDHANKKTRQILGLTNEWYLEETSENIRRTLKAKRSNGEFTGSFAPYGYLVDPDNKNHLIIDEKTAPVVHDIFRWFTEGYGYREIVKRLNEKNIPSPSEYKRQCKSKYVNHNEETSVNNGLWTHTTIYTMIRNETYTGTLVQGKSHNVSYKNKKKLKVPEKDWIRVTGTHEPIIDMETWEKTKQRLQSRQRVSRTTQTLSPLSGKVKCLHCKSPMKRDVYYNKARTRTYYQLVCGSYKTGAMVCSERNAISGKTLEKTIADQLNQLIAGYCDLNSISIKDTKSSLLETYQNEYDSLTAEINKISTKQYQLYNDRLEGLITKEQYMMFSKDIENKNNSFLAQQEKLTARIQEINDSIDNEIMKNDLIKKYTHIDEITREIADEFIEQIYIGRKTDNGEPREIIIDWKI